MNIALKADQLKWLEDEVATGTFASVEDAVRLAVAGLMTMSEDDDLSWAKPLVDDARAAIARGEGTPASAVKAEIAEQLRKLGAA
jgi:antitoxin ParD1/3/4